jgi:hypothetical protein
MVGWSRRGIRLLAVLVYSLAVEVTLPQADPTAPMHPNLAGQAAWGTLLGDALIANIGG